MTGHPHSHRLLRPGLAALVDAVLINLAFLTAFYVRYELQWFRQVDPVFDTTYRSYVPFAVGLTFLCLSAFGLGGVYQAKRGLSWLDEMYPVLNGTTSAIMILVLITFGARPLAFSRLIFFYVAVLVVAYLGAARAVRRSVEARLRARGINVSHVVVVGAGEVGRAVIRQMLARPELGYRIVGFLDDDPVKGSSDLGRLKGLGPLSNFDDVLAAEHVDEVIIALPWADQRKIMRLVHACERVAIPVRIVPDLFQLSLSRVDVANLGGIPLIGIKEANISRSGRLVKRALDLTLSSFGLLLTAPLFLLIAVLIRLDSAGPVLFRQTRVGEGGRPFKIYKFRSMRSGAENEQVALLQLNEATGPLFKIKDDPRLTRVGRWLRRTSLDELPNLLNVIRGEMSLVGPRPGLPSEVERYDSWQRARLDIAPGMSGLWQVSGRSELSFDEMCMLDIYYIENWSLAMDLSILARTVPRVLTGDGAY